MRIVIHDFAGHAFIAQLSRELADRGAEVLHLYSAELDTPQGDLSPKPTDPSDLEIRGIRVDGFHRKNQLVKRFRFERKYGKQLCRQIEAFAPDAVISAQAPSLVIDQLAAWSTRHEVPLVNWVQDLYGLAAYRVLRKKLPIVGGLIGRYFLKLDKRAYRACDATVVITDDFTEIIQQWGVDPASVTTIANWAPLEDLPQRPRENDWSRKQQLGDSLRFIYSGTLSMKHNPRLMLALGEWLHDSGVGTLLVNSQGAAVDWLAKEAAQRGLASIRCLGFQPYNQLPEVFGSADVLVAILEPEAGIFCVPSKVLSYLCSGRALLTAIPIDNLAAKTVQRAGAGEVVEPADVEEFVAAAKRLASSAKVRQAAGQAARDYAEQTFDIGQIGDRFETILRSVLGDDIQVVRSPRTESPTAKAEAIAASS